MAVVQLDTISSETPKIATPAPIGTVVSSHFMHISMFLVENFLVQIDLNFNWNLIETDAKFGIVNSKKSQYNRGYFTEYPH